MGDRGSLAADPEKPCALDLRRYRRPLGQQISGWQRSVRMLDAILVAAGVASFVLAIAYGAACERL
jgi:hypothetical protein